MHQLIKLLPDPSVCPKSLSLETVSKLVEELGKHYKENLNNREVFIPKGLEADLKQFFDLLKFKEVDQELDHILSLMKDNEFNIKIPEKNKFTVFSDIMKAMETKYKDCTVAGVKNIYNFSTALQELSVLLKNTADSELQELFMLWSENKSFELKVIKTYCHGYRQGQIFPEENVLKWLIPAPQSNILIPAELLAIFPMMQAMLTAERKVMQWEEVTYLENGDLLVVTVIADPMQRILNPNASFDRSEPVIIKGNSNPSNISK